MPRNPRAQNPFPAPIDIMGYQEISRSCSTRAMVQLYSGNLLIMLKIVDVDAPTGFPLNLTLYYNSQPSIGGERGPVGWNWTHPFLMATNGVDPTNVLFGPSGRTTAFSLNNDIGTPPPYYWDPDGVTSYFASSYIKSVDYSNIPETMYFPDGSQFVFADESSYYGFPCVYMFDRHGILTDLGNPITDILGRHITFDYMTYSSPDGPVTLITSITDPKGNVTTLGYDTTNFNLTSVTNPAGCVTTFGYATPANHLITSITDPLMNETQYSYYSSSAVLESVTDAESNTITYAYASNYPPSPFVPPSGIENTGDGYQNTFDWTQLIDARGNAWTLHFDTAGNIWRIMDPLGHWRHFYWDSNQKLLYESSGYQYNSASPAYPGPRDNVGNIFRRATYDQYGNLLQLADSRGVMSTFSYVGPGNATDDGGRLLASSYPGQADLFTQGNWQGRYGTNGYILCGFANGSADVEQLPGYIGSISDITFTRTHIADSSGYQNLMDPACPSMSARFSADSVSGRGAAAHSI